VIALIVVIALIFAWYMLKRTRLRHKNPKYVPTAFLKKMWENWEVDSSHYRLPDNSEHLEPQRSAATPTSFDVTATGALPQPGQTAAVGVDRNTSVRSVMTLPAYHPSARESEQVLGREGERAGIDVVIEFPEGADEEEERREAEMEALYQVRVARRQENEEREERRRLRREARERGDYVALRELQAQARAGPAATGRRTVEELRAEHERVKKERLRAVSSVSYAELGVARHDGTRLRANSNDSEREGLLGDAASIGTGSMHHRRDRSASSALSIDTTDLASPSLTRSRGNSRASRPESPGPRRASGQSHISRTATPSPSHEGRAGSSPELIEHDDIPPNSPPGYENISLTTPLDELRNEPPPDYSSPVAGRGERRSMFDSPRNSVVESRRISTPHVGELISERRTSSSTSAYPSHTERRSSSRLGLNEVPQLPSLGLPSIHVNSPTQGSVNEDEEHLPQSHV
jgi:hypothetical protein